MEQNKIIFWEEKIEPVLRIKGSQRRKIKNRLKKINFETRNECWMKKKMRLAYRVGSILKKIPGIVFVGVTGSVASGWPQKSDDVDFLLICHNNRLWLNRLVVTVMLKLAGFKLRNKKKEERNSLCLNMWLEERSLAIEPSRRNILSAIDLVWLKPVVNKGQFWQKFIIANKWAKRYVKINIKYRKGKIFKEKNNKILEIFNWLAYKIQYLYMKKKITREIVSFDRAYFHPNGKIDFDKI